MTPSFGNIGIDFGTSNSHFAYCNYADKPSPEAVGIGKGGSMPTCVLWKHPATEEDHVLSYGEQAQAEWIGLDSDERSRLRFAFGFKPDIVHSDRARRDAWAFLRRAYADLEQAGLPRPVGKGGYTVVIGVPAEIGEQHRAVTAQVAEEAGFGAVVCVEEPLGALAYHLQKGDLVPAEARKGVMVIDFGGGTFDVALVNNHGLQEPWGDPTLGGRLFDDLFLQWVLDQNPAVTVSEQDALVVWQRECRNIKEEFSTAWATALKHQKPLPDFKRAIEVGDRKVWLRNPTVDEFERRARSYTPSHVVRKYLRGLDRPANGLVIDQPVDLFARIRQVLTRGRPRHELAGKFARVILTGGSCWWPFMKTLVTEELGVTPEQVMMSQNPEATIGAGLALYNVLTVRNKKRSAEIEIHKPTAKKDFAKATSDRLDRYADDVSKAIVGVIMPRVEQVYTHWYNNGGSLNAVEGRVRQICQEFESKEAEGIVKRHWTPLNVDLVRLMRDHLTKFLAQNEIPSLASEYIPESVTSIEDFQAGSQGTKGRIASEVGDMAAVIAVVTGAVLVVLAAIKAKVFAAVMLASLTHPPLAIALGIGALVAAAVAGGVVRQLVEDKIKSHEFNWVTRNLLYVALWESSFKKNLADGRAEALAQMKKAIRKSTHEVDAAAAKADKTKQSLEQLANSAFSRTIDEVIRDLGVLDQIRVETVK